MKQFNFYSRYKNPLLIVILLIVFAGVYAYQNMKTELLPNVTFPKIKIIADNGDQPAENMLITVTRPIEEAIKKSENLQNIKSVTSRGSSEISAFYNWSSDLNVAQQQIESRISEIKQDLPANVKLVIEKMNPSILPIAGYSLEGNKSPIELRLLALYTIKPYLEQISGVREAAVVGGKTKEYQLLLDQQKMSVFGITPTKLKDVLASTNFIQANGFIKDYRHLYLSLTDATIKNLNQLKNTIVKSTPQGIIKIKDIATVKIAEEQQYIKIKANSKNVPLIAVIKNPEANLISINSKLSARIKTLNQRILPKGIVLKPFYNQADFVNGSVKSIRDVLWIGLSLALLITLLFLYSLRSSLIILITVPVSLALSLVGLYYYGYNFNIMTLGAIAAALGLVIDDAVVIVEQIHRTKEEHPEESYNIIVKKAIKFLFPAMVGSSLSTIVIFLPFAIMSGIAGAYFTILTQTMIITLTASFAVTWALLPALYIFIFKNAPALKTKPHKNKKWVAYVIKKPVIALLVVIGFLLSIIIIFPKLPSGFLPEMDEGAIVLDYVSPPGSTLEETNNMLIKVDAILAKISEISSYSRRTGTQMGFFITEPNRGDYLIQLKDKRHLKTTEVIDEIRQRVAQKIPALQVDFGQVIGDMLGDLMSSVQPIAIKLFGSDQKIIQNYSKKIATLVSKVKGTADVFDGIIIAGPATTTIPDVAKLRRYNLTPSDFQFQLETQIGGVVVGSILDKNQMTNIRMIQNNWQKTGVNSLKNKSLMLSNGQLRSLSDFAKTILSKGSSEIDRENLKNVGYITARLNNRDLGSTLKDIQRAIQKNINLPQGYTIEYGGEFKQQQQAFRELGLILILATLLVFLVILFLFKKIKIGLMFIVLIALGPAGSLILLYLFNITLNVGSYIGIIMIIGIVGEASIFTYLQYDTERKSGKPLDEAIVSSVSIRLRPNLMTSFAAIVALTPLALGIGTGAQMHQPLAIAVIGGFLAAIPILLIILPSFIRIIDK
ncbi:MAG: efflux RND transporter permease subunit [Flavobacteriaceae bacterium]